MNHNTHRILLSSFIILIIAFLITVIFYRPDQYPRSMSQVNSLCRDMFKPGDKVNGMADSCYEDFKARGMLSKDGLNVKEQL